MMKYSQHHEVEDEQQRPYDIEQSVPFHGAMRATPAPIMAGSLGGTTSRVPARAWR
jgi:tartrate dehydratase beta subunit/fumarate hydratase class I family protein